MYSLYQKKVTSVLGLNTVLYDVVMVLYAGLLLVNIFSSFAYTMKLTLLILLLCGYVRAYKTIIDVLSENAKFSTLIRHLQHTHLIPMINNLEGGTFFAPDNEAFEKYKGPELTKDLILYHLLPKQYSTKELGNGQLLESSYVRPGFLGTETKGQMLKITEKLDTFFHVNEARIKDRDVFVNWNTTMNVVDRVLEPPPILCKQTFF